MQHKTKHSLHTAPPSSCPAFTTPLMDVLLTCETFYGSLSSCVCLRAVVQFAIKPRTLVSKSQMIIVRKQSAAVLTIDESSEPLLKEKCQTTARTDFLNVGFSCFSLFLITGNVLLLGFGLFEVVTLRHFSQFYRQKKKTVRASLVAIGFDCYGFFF